MFVVYTVALAAAIHLRQPVKLPFPDADKALEDLNEENAAQQAAQPPAMVEQATAVTTGSDDAVAAWTPPTLAPDPAVMTTDQFKHPTAQQLKEWEQAPKIDMFEEPTMKPLSLAPDFEATEKKPAAAAPVEKVESKIHPVNPYGKRDDDAELAAIQQESPEAYGIVKALLMKKTMGLPMPGADSAKKESDAARSFGSVEAGPSSSAHIGDMFNWKPTSSASDDLSVMEDTSSVSKAVVDDAPEPKAQVEEPLPEMPKAEPAPKKDMFNWKPASVDEDTAAEAPAPASAPAAAPKEASVDSDEGIALNSWLGATAKVAPPQEHAAASSMSPIVGGNDMMSRYAADLA
jgi:hypothetical protein